MLDIFRKLNKHNVDYRIRYTIHNKNCDNVYEDITEYIDKDAAIQDIIDSDGYGNILNGYDGNYELVDIDGETFVVMRTS